MASPFASRLGTNYCPTDEELLEINALLVEPTLRLKGLDDEITKLQKAIDKLAEERSRVAAYIEAHKALLSPVRRLPLDIIQELFVACLPTHRNCVMSASEAPVLLGRVCSSWRTISRTTPRLWSSLHVVEPLQNFFDPTSASFEEKVARRLKITQMWLGRSGQCPLSISLQSAPDPASPPGTPTPSGTSMRFMKTLLSFAPRWQHIQLTAPLPLLLEIMSRSDAEVPLLETVAFHSQGHNSLPFPWGPLNMLRGARISSFSVPGAIFLPENLPLQWSQLTNLTVGGHKWSVPPTITSDALLRVISKCPGLRCCKVMVHDSNGIELPISEHPIVELPFLHTFAIDCIARTAPAVSNLLMRLSLPELRDFAIFGSTPDSPTLGNFFARLVRLESLRINLNIFSRTSLLETFHTLPPSIRHLRISGLDDPWGAHTQPGLDEMLAALTTSPELCPMLRHLSIDSGITLSDRAVLLFITARMQESPPALNRVDINFGRQVVVNIMPDLRTFIEMGLAVSLVYLPPQTSQDSPWLGLPDAPVNPNTSWATWVPPESMSNW
ncbi:hypothetical protein MSAN_00103800 [Mycena sanguinolenta]|uniref:F-box domain-containing protein n=1 Tax=Mycena sanguinolenta TaxID=230812 RepID=A0A8H6ZD66_9AGAR|nr:hypothetical protein MSAN_02370700 [Mycena sanguinolenta]KAF7376863.1 hypothetical protein MSAN_00103800 [Mycena sanguinolenta]